MILTGVVLHQFPQAAFKAFDYRRFWRHSLAVGACASLIAQSREGDPHMAFTAGLLHDIGRLVIRLAFGAEGVSDVYARVNAGTAAHTLESAAFGFSHSLVGQMLAMKWGFPIALQQAIGLHHTTQASQLPQLVDLVHVADCMVQAFDLGEWPQHSLQLEYRSWSRLGMDEQLFQRIIDEVQRMDLSADFLLD